MGCMKSCGTRKGPAIFTYQHQCRLAVTPLYINLRTGSEQHGSNVKVMLLHSNKQSCLPITPQRDASKCKTPYTAAHQADHCQILCKPKYK
eukprot:148308-Amphidinium_carterae.1